MKNLPAHLPQEAGVLLVGFMPMAAAIRLDMVASLVALATAGAAEVAAKELNQLKTEKRITGSSFFYFPEFVHYKIEFVIE